MPGVGKLIALDYITESYHLTRRGLLVAKDFTEGAAPWRDDDDVVHARPPLAVVAACDFGNVFESLKQLSTERYGKLRALGETVTCLACVRIAQ